LRHLPDRFAHLRRLDETYIARPYGFRPAAWPWCIFCPDDRIPRTQTQIHRHMLCTYSSPLTTCLSQTVPNTNADSQPHTTALLDRMHPGLRNGLPEPRWELSLLVYPVSHSSFVVHFIPSHSIPTPSFQHVPCLALRYNNNIRLGSNSPTYLFSLGPGQSRVRRYCREGAQGPLCCPHSQSSQLAHDYLTGYT
jgi:hypothetical protein